jgi:photosystem II stability/assembly factor-like uncharacterized protein
VIKQLIKILLLGGSLLLLGCEAPLVLDEIQKEQQQPYHRFDRFLSAAGNDQALVVVGAMGLVLHSDDQGMHWARETLSGEPTLIDVTACPDGDFAALAIEEGQVWLSEDQGANWSPVTTGSQEVPQAITCDVNNRLWVVGSFTSILSSVDKGRTWSAQSMDEDAILTYVHFFDAEQGIIVGEFGMVLKTRDGGSSWQRGEPIPDEFYPLAAWFDEPMRGWVAGVNGVIQSTEDGGQTWQKDVTGTHAPIYAFMALGDQLYASGEFGTVLRRKSPAGTGIQHWDLIDTGHDVRFFLRALWPVGEQLLFGGEAGVLFITPAATLQAAEAQG